MNLEADYNSTFFKTHFLIPGTIFVSKTPVIISTILGSCISVCIFDRENKWGGMNHYINSHSWDSKNQTPQYGDIAMKELVAQFYKFGSYIENLSAMIFGGTTVEGNENLLKITTDNINIAKNSLDEQKIKITLEDTGGFESRKLFFKTDTNEFLIRKLAKPSFTIFK